MCTAPADYNARFKVQTKKYHLVETKKEKLEITIKLKESIDKYYSVD